MTQLLPSVACVQTPVPEQVSVVHARRSSQEGTPQQTLLTQLPLAQANPWVHAPPLGCFWQVVPTQLLPPDGSELDGVKALQSAAVALHLVLHCPVPVSH
jgi:predicted permease